MKNKLLNILLVLTSFLITCIILEVALRLVYPQYFYYPRYIYVSDEYTGFRLRSNFSKKFKTLDFAVSYNITEQGFRDTRVFQKEKSNFRIIGLGDSYTFGIGVEVQDTYLKLLENKDTIDVINTGTSGYGTIHQLNLLKYHLKDYEYDLVILLFCDNDPIDNLEGISREVYNGYLVPKHSKYRIVQYMITYASDHSQLMFLLIDRIKNSKFLYGLFRDKNRAKAIHGQEKNISHSVSDEEWKGIERTQTLLLEFYREVLTKNAKLVLVFIDDTYVEKLKPVLNDNDIPFLNLTPAFLGKERDFYRFPHDGHWNSVGHKIASEAIYQFLVDNNFVPIHK